jgi:hypothetical protein
MTAPGRTDAGPPIICPVTGRTWPRAYQIALKLCAACGGWIDIRREAWRDGPLHAPECPTPPIETTLGQRAPGPRIKAETADPWPRDEVHDAIMREIQAEQLAANEVRT